MCEHGRHGAKLLAVYDHKTFNHQNVINGESFANQHL